MKRWKAFDEKIGVQRDNGAHRALLSIAVCESFYFGLRCFALKSEYQFVGKLMGGDGGSEVDFEMTPRVMFHPIREKTSIYDWLELN